MSDGGKYTELGDHSDETTDEGERNLQVAKGNTAIAAATGKGQSVCTKENAILVFRYLQVYFVTIATILGTGILGLPDTLSRSGFNPFVLTITISYISQLLMIYLFTELLQKAAVIQQVQQNNEVPDQQPETAGENIPLKSVTNNNKNDSGGELSSDSQDEAPLVEAAARRDPDTSPSLYTLASLFLPPLAKHVFNLVIVLQFMGLLVTYALAGSEAYAAILNVSYVVVIPFFTWILSLFIIFVYKLVTPVISLLTLAKGSVLIATVMVTLHVGRSIAVDYVDNYKYTGEPFLLGTVALGGVVNTMPLVFTHIRLVQRHVYWYRMCCMLGLSTCFVLNLAWCWSVLNIVPQTDTCGSLVDNATHNAAPSPLGGSRATVATTHCDSLQRAKDEGQISTIPLTDIIEAKYPVYDWVRMLVESFIMVSITVSFLTIGAALHHTTLGCVEELWHSGRQWYDARWRRVSTGGPTGASADGKPTTTTLTTPAVVSYSKAAFSALVALTLFGLVFLIAMLNPQGFEIILEKAVSLLINLESGVFFFLMIQCARSSTYSGVRIPCETWHWLRWSHYPLLIYFTVAVAYDVLLLLYKAATGRDLPE